MTAVNRSRNEVLRALLRLERPPSEIATLLSGMEWDAERPLVELGRRGMREVLHSAVVGRIPAAHVEAWADLIEGREDIGREPGSEGILNEALFELANPALSGTTIEKIVEKWARRLA
jgi:hypothetical protein